MRPTPQPDLHRLSHPGTCLVPPSASGARRPVASTYSARGQPAVFFEDRDRDFRDAVEKDLVAPKPPQSIAGAGDPSDQWVTGTIRMLSASGESWNCGLSIGGAPGRSAPQVAAWARGK